MTRRRMPAAARARGEQAWLAILRSKHPGSVWTMRDAPRTTREHARTVACPACGAAAGEPCQRLNGNARLGAHEERHAAAIAAGAEPIDVRSRKKR